MWKVGGELGRKVSAIGWAHVAALAIAFTVAVFGVNGHSGPTRHSAAVALPAQKHVSAAPVSVEGAARPLYPYSVIPGGVENVPELKNALLRDSVAAAHYADFDVGKARVVRLNQDRLAFVSYRIGSHIFWTSKKVRLPKGETIITDGAHEARTRCGNRVSDLPGQPVSPHEPPQQALEPPSGPELVTLLEPPPFSFPIAPPPSPETPPSNPPGGGAIPPPFFPPIGGGSPPPPSNPHQPTTPPIPPGPPPGPPVWPTPPPTVRVSEPSSIAMFAAGVATLLAAGGLVNFRRRRGV